MIFVICKDNELPAKSPGPANREAPSVMTGRFVFGRMVKLIRWARDQWLTSPLVLVSSRPGRGFTNNR